MRKFGYRLLQAFMLVMLTSAWSVAAEQAEPRVKIDITGHPVKGPASAPVTIVVFSDYL